MNIGYIYTIRSTETKKYYIGSTKQPLTKRLYEHRKNYRNYKNGGYRFVSVFDIIKYDDNYIELLEIFNYDNKLELTKREGELIRQYRNEVINIRIEGRTGKQYYQDNLDKIKEYNQDNKIHISQIKKEYAEKNKDAIKEYRKKYNEENKEKIKEYFIKNKEILKQKRIEKRNKTTHSKVELKLDSL